MMLYHTISNFAVAVKMEEDFPENGTAAYIAETTNFDAVTVAYNILTPVNY